MDHGLSHASDGIADGLAAVCTVVKGSHMVASQSAFDLTRDMLAEYGPFTLLEADRAIYR